MMNKKVIITKSAEETKQFAKELAQQVPLSSIITLTGDLGAGKTTFVQGLANGFGIDKKVNSPTFLLIKKYAFPLSDPQVDGESKSLNASTTLRSAQQKNGLFYHVDLYRLTSAEEVMGTGLFDILKEKNSFVVIEWAEKMGKFLPEKRIDVQFEYIDEGRRKITICKK